MISAIARMLGESGNPIQLGGLLDGCSIELATIGYSELDSGSPCSRLIRIRTRGDSESHQYHYQRGYNTELTTRRRLLNQQHSQPTSHPLGMEQNDQQRKSWEVEYWQYSHQQGRVCQFQWVRKRQKHRSTPQVD
jgi:hypothetical protein